MRQQSRMTFVITEIRGASTELLVFPRKIHMSYQFALCAERFGLFSRYRLRKLKGSPHRLAGASFFNWRSPSHTICNRQSRQRSTPEHPFGGNAVVYQN